MSSCLAGWLVSWVIMMFVITERPESFELQSALGKSWVKICFNHVLLLTKAYEHLFCSPNLKYYAIDIVLHHFTNLPNLI